MMTWRIEVATPGGWLDMDPSVDGVWVREPAVKMQQFLEYRLGLACRVVAVLEP